MENQIANDSVRKLVDQLAQQNNGSGRALVVNDLKLTIRDQRMSEVSDWSNFDLDVAEAHAARFDGDAPLESVFHVPVDNDRESVASAVASICAPSPVAWM